MYIDLEVQIFTGWKNHTRKEHRLQRTQRLPVAVENGFQCDSQSLLVAWTAELL